MAKIKLPSLFFFLKIIQLSFNYYSYYYFIYIFRLNPILNYYYNCNNSCILDCSYNNYNFIIIIIIIVIIASFS